MAYEEELPSVGMAKSLMSQFKQKEAEAKQVQNYKPSGAGNRVSISISISFWVLIISVI